DEERGLFPSREVTTTFGAVEVGDVRIVLLDPAERRPEDLTWELREADRNCRRRWRLSCRSRGRLPVRALPVGPRGRRPGAREPVHTDVVEHVIAREVAGRLLVHERSGDLLVAVGVVVEHPRGQGDG